MNWDLQLDCDVTRRSLHDRSDNAGEDSKMPANS